MLNLSAIGMATLARRSVPAGLGPNSTKRAIDIVGAVLGMIVLSPVMLLVVVALWCTGARAVFAQERCGLNGRRFRFYKFRTMVDDAEDQRKQLGHLNEMTGPVFKMARDPRVTRLGAVLRKSSLDELPQLWNVLRGEMSLVGPRPPLPEEVARYDMRQLQRLTVMGGITGLWQVSGRSSIDNFDKWLELDLAYARRWSLWLDLRILAKTVVVVISARGAQ
jgi:lipopolysaccharide/colanic/teichoic acid biosynthesis glycosyltransferase